MSDLLPPDLPAPDVPTIDDMMSAYALDAIDYARDAHGVVLDYAEDSIQRVETILAKLHDSMPRNAWSKFLSRGPSEERIDQFSKMFGGYVGEVIKRTWGGNWKLDAATFPGQTVYTFHILGHRIWPHFKAGKRIVNGPEDNVWHYYQVLRQDFQQHGAPKTDETKPDESV